MDLPHVLVTSAGERIPDRYSHRGGGRGKPVVRNLQCAGWSFHAAWDRFGNVARRAGRGPGTTNLDFCVFRNFRVREPLNPQFRAEAFNL
jgi:hypothetical protein